MDQDFDKPAGDMSPSADSGAATNANDGNAGAPSADLTQRELQGDQNGDGIVDRGVLDPDHPVGPGELQGKVLIDGEWVAAPMENPEAKVPTGSEMWDKGKHADTEKADETGPSAPSSVQPAPDRPEQAVDGAMTPPALEALSADRIPSKPDVPDLTPDEQIALRTAEVQRRAAQESAQAAIERARLTDVPEDEQKAPVIALADGSASNGENAETLAKREQRANALALLDERLAEFKNDRFNLGKAFQKQLDAIAVMEKERAEIAAQGGQFGTEESPADQRKLHDSAIDPLMDRVRPAVREMAPYQ